MSNYNNLYPLSTYARSIYSIGFSFITIFYFRTNLRLLFHPFEREGKMGRQHYSKDRVLAELYYDDAAAIYIVANKILDGKNAAQGCCLTLQCSKGSSLILDRRPGEKGQMDTFLVASDDNQTVPFKFSTQTYKVEENGVMVEKVTDTGLGVFSMILEGYLTGINASGHLDKMGDELERIQVEDQQDREQQAISYSVYNNGIGNGNQSLYNPVSHQQPNNSQVNVNQTNENQANTSTN